jgi:hypothetical protein
MSHKKTRVISTGAPAIWNFPAASIARAEGRWIKLRSEFNLGASTRMLTQRNENSQKRDAILGVVAVLLIGGFFVAGWSNDDAKKMPEQRREHNCSPIRSIFAFQLAKEAAKLLADKQLFAPSTAKFASYDNNMVANDGCTFRINSYVDAQNSFGAMLRAQYRITLEYIPETDKWELRQARLWDN